jgi:hypothetical protein
MVITFAARNFEFAFNRSHAPYYLGHFSGTRVERAERTKLSRRFLV